MAGKNKTERGFTFTFAGTNLSNDLVPGTVQGGGIDYEEVDMTGVGNDIMQALPGFGDSTINAQFHMNDAAGGATTVLNANLGSSATLALAWGENGAAPTTGDPEWSGTYLLLSARVVQANGRFVHDCVFKPMSGASDPSWGTV